MQTFLPYADFKKSLACLDNKRLGKQRVEAMQILNAIKYKTGWKHHPIVKMWTGYEEALKLYMNLAIDEWLRRGFKNNMEYARIEQVVFPYWLGDQRVHKSHKSNLLRKDKVHYSQFGWSVSDDLKYYWVIDNDK